MSRQWFFRGGISAREAAEDNACGPAAAPVPFPSLEVSDHFARGVKPWDDLIMPIQDLRIDVDAHTAETGMPVIGLGHGIEWSGLDLLFQILLELAEIRIIVLVHKLVVPIHGGNQVPCRDLDDLRELRQGIRRKGASSFEGALEMNLVGGCGIADAPPLVDALFMQNGEPGLATKTDCAVHLQRVKKIPYQKVLVIDLKCVCPFPHFVTS